MNNNISQDREVFLDFLIEGSHWHFKYETSFLSSRDSAIRKSFWKFDYKKIH